MINKVVLWFNELVGLASMFIDCKGVKPFTRRLYGLG